MPDWQAVSKWYWNLSKPHLDATTPEMKQTVDSLTAGATTEMDRIKAVFYYVSKKIRYMGLTPEKDRPGFEPHDVKITFDKKYGVCRDKAALLVSLLAKPAQRLSGPHQRRRQARPGSARPGFQSRHRLRGTQEGRILLMDPTDENTRELLPAAIATRATWSAGPKARTSSAAPSSPRRII